VKLRIDRDGQTKKLEAERLVVYGPQNRPIFVCIEIANEQYIAAMAGDPLFERALMLVNEPPPGINRLTVELPGRVST